jgi:hypothetical protein
MKGTRVVGAMVRDNGSGTFGSCKRGATDIVFVGPTDRSAGTGFGPVRAREICTLSGTDVFEAKRVVARVDLYEGT